LIQADGLIEKAGLLELDTNALYGALLTIKTDTTDPDIVPVGPPSEGCGEARRPVRSERVLPYAIAACRNGTRRLAGSLPRHAWTRPVQRRDDALKEPRS
jgi:hypothetical protein